MSLATGQLPRHLDRRPELGARRQRHLRRERHEGYGRLSIYFCWATVDLWYRLCKRGYCIGKLEYTVDYRFFPSGGAVALDGRIEPGDMILQVNEVRN